VTSKPPFKHHRLLSVVSEMGQTWAAHLFLPRSSYLDIENPLAAQAEAAENAG